MAEEKKDLNNEALTEKRRFPRLATSVDVEYKILKDKTLSKETVTKNIGAGGICLIAYEKVEVGSLLSLELRLPEGHSAIEAKGRVVWSSYFTIEGDRRDRYDLGIEFTQLSESDRQKLSQYVFKLIK